MQCPKCTASLLSPLVCLECGGLVVGQKEQNPFTLLGLQPSFELEQRQLEQRYEELLLQVHPDLFSQADATLQSLSLQYSAWLMRAKRELEQPFKRALCLLGLHQKKPADQALQPPQEFLVKMFVWQEQLEQSLPPQETQTLQAEIAQELLQTTKTLQLLFKQLIQKPTRFDADTALHQALGKLKFLQNAQDPLGFQH